MQITTPVNKRIHAIIPNIPSASLSNDLKIRATMANINANNINNTPIIIVIPPINLLLLAFFLLS